MRRYQDLIDGYLMKNNRDVINMLNTKYSIVQGGDGQPKALQNPHVYGPAWLVSDLEIVASNDAEFAALGTVEDLRATAIIHQDFAEQVAGLAPDGEGDITITSYAPNELKYAFTSSSEQLVVFSEIWYGPDLGWKAYIDGEPADLLRANYLLRALRVPAGRHDITLEFDPASYTIGVTLSYICSILILLGLVAYAVYTILQRRAKEDSVTTLDRVPKQSS